MKIDELPRKAVLGYLELTRLPLTAAERALGKTEGTWPPTIAADRVQAAVKRIAGGVLRDETLKADAELQTAALDERVRAAALEIRADEVRAETAELEDEAKSAVDQRAAAKRAAARRGAAVQEDVISRRATKVKQEALADEAVAVGEERAALEAKAEAIELEDELEQARAARKNA